MKFKLIVKVVPDIEVVIEASDPTDCLTLAHRCMIALIEAGYSPKLDYAPIEGLPISIEASSMSDFELEGGESKVD